MSSSLRLSFNEWYDRTGEQEKRIQLAYHQGDAVVTLDIEAQLAYDQSDGIRRRLHNVPFLYGSRQEMWQYRHQSYIWVVPLFDQAVLETPYRMSGLIFDLKSKQAERGCSRCRLDYWMQWSRLRKALTQWTQGKWPVLLVFV